MILSEVSDLVYHYLLGLLVFLVTVRNATRSNRFKGIVLVAKDESSQNILGSWSSTDSAVKVISCDGTSSNGITQTSSRGRSQIQATWHSPSTTAEEYVVI
ncbi:unnamed protein product, partial [Rotaria sp. Silwood2]